VNLLRIARLFKGPPSERETRLFQATRPFNWQPQEHYGPEGSEDFSDWNQTDFNAAATFLQLSDVAIEWKKASPEWIESLGVKGEPDWFADTSEGLFVIGENIWIGFPDPPQFTIVQLLPESRSKIHLGHFDDWPEQWTRDAQD
jgi:hypothetical protein